MSIQEMFEKGYLGVLRQGKLSKRPKPKPEYGFSCFYLQDDGSRCVVGHCISKEAAIDLDVDCVPVANVRFKKITEKHGCHFDMTEIEFLKDFQSIHDYSEDLEEFKQKAVILAKRYNLKIPENLGV